jgi:hypothetical protein
MSVGKLTIPGRSLGPEHAELVLDVVHIDEWGCEPWGCEPGASVVVREPMSGALFELIVPSGAYAAVIQYDDPDPDPEISEPRIIAVEGLSRLLRVRWALEEEEERRRGEVSVPDGAPF